MIRILQVLGSLQRGGAETMILNVYRNIDRNKIQFDFLVKEHVTNGYEEEVKSLGGNIYCVESAKKIGILKYIKKLKRIMKENGPFDIIHSHVNTLSGIILFAAKLANIRIRISHSHTTKQKNMVLKLLIHFFANKKIACSEETGKKLFGNSKFDIIPNGIITNNFLPSKIERDEIIKKLKFVNKTMNICHIGRFVEVKNHSFIIELAEKLKNNNMNFRIYLLGDGPLFNNIKDMIKQKHLTKYIELVGSVSNANEYLKASDLFILPSLYEGIPVTLIEAQCSGIPSIISNNISKDVDLGLNLIKYLPLNSEKWKDLVISNRFECIFDTNLIKQKFVEKEYDIEISSKKLIELYEKWYNTIKL